MKNLKYKLLFLIALLSSVVFAQENQPFPKVEEMHNRKWQFLVEKAQLSPKDVEVVQPIFMEYEKALWNFHAKNGDFFKSLRNKKNDPTLNYSDINDRYVEMEVTQVQMFKSYHLKLKKILTPETLFKYYKADREFKRTLLQKLQERKEKGKRFGNSDI